jgi:RNA polymerase sigma-70 factor, ECF subfamily
MRHAMAADQKEFPAIYAEYRPKIVGYLRRLVGEADAKDVAQEVFVKVGKALEGFRGDSSLSTWIYRIATNTATDHLRKFSSRQVLDFPNISPGDDTSPDYTMPDEGAPILDMFLIRKDMNECIRGIVDSLLITIGAFLF